MPRRAEEPCGDNLGTGICLANVTAWIRVSYLQCMQELAKKERLRVGIWDHSTTRGRALPDIMREERRALHEAQWMAEQMCEGRAHACLEPLGADPAAAARHRRPERRSGRRRIWPGG